MTPTSKDRRPTEEGHESQLLRVQCFNVSTDGFGAGEGQSLEHPFGHANPADLFVVGRRHRELARTAPTPAAPEGSTTTSPATSPRNIGAEIMGRNKFGPQRGPWENHDWKGWWGDTPPFHTPVFVLTHHARPSFTLSDTTFHFIDATPAEALRQAKEAADGKDVRLGGGVATVREFLDADLVDTMHIAVAPIELGRGERLWDSPRRTARPLPPRHRAQPERRDPPAVLAAVTRASAAQLRCAVQP